MNDNTFLYIITFFMFVGALVLILIEYVFKKWKCTDGKCERVLGGDYSHLKDCIASKNCKKTPESVSSTQNGFNCVNGECKQTNENPYFGSYNECNQHCRLNNNTNIHIPTYSYGYPYFGGIYPYGANYGYGRRWRPRRRSPRRLSGRRL